MSKRTRRQNVRTMSQHESAAASKGAIVPAGEGGSALEAFTFGDPEPVLSRATMLDMLECWHNSRWYEAPIPLDGLARAYRASPHHSSAIILKRNMLAASLDPASRLSRKAFAGLVQDYLVMGNAYVQQVRNRLGGVLRIDHCLAKYVRRGVEPGRFWWVPSFQNETEFEPGSVLAAHRVPPQLLGIVPANAGGFGDVTKATDAFFELEIEPLQSVFLELNDMLGVEAVQFRERVKVVQ